MRKLIGLVTLKAIGDIIEHSTVAVLRLFGDSLLIFWFLSNFSRTQERRVAGTDSDQWPILKK